jgi:hypothetical protein
MAWALGNRWRSKELWPLAGDDAAALAPKKGPRRHRSAAGVVRRVPRSSQDLVVCDEARRELAEGGVLGCVGSAPEHVEGSAGAWLA